MPDPGLTIGSRAIAPYREPYIIAELGVNHDGSVDRAMALAKAAVGAGADAVKLQLFKSESLLSNAAHSAPYQKHSGFDNPHAMLQRLELTLRDMAHVVDEAHKLNIHAIVTIFSHELVDQANQLPWDAFKVASPDVINRSLIDALMRTDRPLFVSTGGTSLEEVRQVTQWLGEYPHILMHCVSAYPTPDEYAALAGRIAMMSVNPRALGYSDHTTSVDTGAIAVASGACVLEKHLTHDRDASGPDHVLSLEPDEFAEYVRLSRRAHRMIGDPIKQCLDIERDVKTLARQSLTAARDLPAGHVLEAVDITIKRPGMGLSPSLLESVIGRRLAKPAEGNMPLTSDHLA